MTPEIVKGWKRHTRCGYEIVAGPFKNDQRLLGIILIFGRYVQLAWSLEGPCEACSFYDLVRAVPDPVIFVSNVIDDVGDGAIFDEKLIPFIGHRVEVTVKVKETKT